MQEWNSQKGKNGEKETSLSGSGGGAGRWWFVVRAVDMALRGFGAPGVERER
jgi:hypothetical protein